LPDGEFLLFEGYLTGLSYNKTLGQEHAVLQARHWLLDMDYSSALSDSSHPLNPSQFTYRTMHALSGAGGSESWTPFMAQGLITPSTLADDFWKEGLYPWLKELTNEDLINTDELSFLGGGGGSNSTAAQALNRFTFSSGNYVPLQLDLRGADADAVADAIWNDVQMETYEAFANTTLWGKLVGDFASRYLFAVVPRVEDALVVPYVPGLRDTWTHELKASDYHLLGASSELMRLLRGVGVFTGLKSRTGADLREPGPGLAAARHRRLVLSRRDGPRHDYAQARPALADEYHQHRSVLRVLHGCWCARDRHRAASARGHSRGCADARQPETVQQTSGRRLRGVAVRLRAAAAAADGTERQTPLPTSLRDRPSPRKLWATASFENDSLQQNVLGDVLRITYIIDSENTRAATDFHLAHVRTQTENKKPGFSTVRHPLWKETWPGAGLISKYD
jgi:hypothetical protein